MSSKPLKERTEEIEDLVSRVQKGEHEAFGKLYDIFVDPLYRYIYYRVSSEDAEDLLETVFLKVWENIKKYKAGKGKFSSWIYRITHNLVVDYYRVSKDRDTLELNLEIADDKREHNPIRVTQNSLNQEYLKKALNKLKKHYQDIIIYKFIDCYSNSEIADLLGKSEGSLRILQFRALKALRKELEDLGVNYDQIL